MPILALDQFGNDCTQMFTTKVVITILSIIPKKLIIYLFTLF